MHAVIICLINPLEGLLVRSYYGSLFVHLAYRCIPTVSRYAAMVAAGTKPCRTT